MGQDGLAYITQNTPFMLLPNVEYIDVSLLNLNNLTLKLTTQRIFCQLRRQ